jgi:hypothetical protein
MDYSVECMRVHYWGIRLRNHNRNEIVASKVDENPEGSDLIVDPFQLTIRRNRKITGEHF